MTRVALSSSFRRAFKKRVEGRPELEASFWHRVEIFTEIRTIRDCARPRFPANYGTRGVSRLNTMCG